MGRSKGKMHFEYQRPLNYGTYHISSCPRQYQLGGRGVRGVEAGGCGRRGGGVSRELRCKVRGGKVVRCGGRGGVRGHGGHVLLNSGTCGHRG